MSSGAPRFDGTMLLGLRENALNVRARDRYQMIASIIDAFSESPSEEYFHAFDENVDRAHADFVVSKHRSDSQSKPQDSRSY